MNMITVPHCAESCLPCADCCDCTPADPMVGRLQRWAWGLTALTIRWYWSWWWADAIVGLFVAGLACNEGRAAWTTADLCAAELPGARVLAPVHCLAACCPACPVPA
jgi:hypothetical protein